MADERLFWIALSSIAQVGNITFRRLLERFETPSKILSAPLGALSAVPGVSPHAVRAIVESRAASLSFAETQCRRLDQIGATLLTISDSSYPPLLRQIADPPPVLFVRGTIPEGEEAIAIVGSRKATRHGLDNASRLSADLSRKGITIVSGFARGIDTAAHRSALDAGGHTIAVLGCGIDMVYPPENRDLYERIASEGALVSEYLPGVPPRAEHFPRRNRIVSGLARGVIVVEAAEKSGTLITAHFALEQGREVFAVPGNISTGMNRGCHWLIKRGAKLVESAADVLEEFSLSPPMSPYPSKPPPDLCSTGVERGILEALTDEPRSIDELVVSTGLTPSELSSILLRLELEGVILQLPGKLFALS